MISVCRQNCSYVFVKPSWRKGSLEGRIKPGLRCKFWNYSFQTKKRMLNLFVTIRENGFSRFWIGLGVAVTSFRAGGLAGEKRSVRAEGRSKGRSDNREEERHEQGRTEMRPEGVEGGEVLCNQVGQTEPSRAGRESEEGGHQRALFARLSFVQCPSLSSVVSWHFIAILLFHRPLRSSRLPILHDALKDIQCEASLLNEFNGRFWPVSQSELKHQ